jgi:hypothetical protein
MVLVLLAAAVSLVPGPGVAQDAGSFRLFFKDGTTVSTYGEYARVGDRVVLTVQVGEVAPGQPRLQLVTLAADAVDWPRTEEYLDSLRATRYGATRGEADYAALTSRVAEALGAAAGAADPARRLELVEQMRREVADWPRTHYGYRARDVAQISALLDEAVSGLRAAAGARQFDLDLVASVEPPPRAVLPPPTPAEAIEQVLGLARRAEVPAERLSLLDSALAYVQASRDFRKGERGRFNRRIRAALEVEMTVERKYAELARRAVAEASLRAAGGDVRGVEKVLVDVARADGQLGHQRPDQMTALAATLQAKLDAARRLRLGRDQWVLRSAACEQYGDAAAIVFHDLDRSRRGLEDIKKLAGPGAKTLVTLAGRLGGDARRLAAVAPAEPASSIHALLASSLQLAVQAVDVRQQAVRSGDVSAAWNASAAAAGSLMLLDRARQEMDACRKPPGLR